MILLHIFLFDKFYDFKKGSFETPGFEASLVLCNSTGLLEGNGKRSTCMQCYLSGHSDGSLDSTYGDEVGDDLHHGHEDHDVPAVMCPSDSKDSGLGVQQGSRPVKPPRGAVTTLLQGEQEGEDEEEEEDEEDEGDVVVMREEN